MSLDTIDILGDGLRNTFSKNGLIFAAAAYILSLISTVSSQSLATDWIGSTLPGQSTASAAPLAMNGPTPLFALLGLVAWIGTGWLMIGAIRSFVNEETSSLNLDYFKENITATLLNFLVGGLVFAILVGLGTVLLIIPGIFIAVSLILFSVYVAEENQNFIEAFKSSWSVAKGNRLSLFLIGVGVTLIGFIFGIAFGIPSGILSFINPGIGVLISNIGNAVGTVLGVGTIASVYNRIEA